MSAQLIRAVRTVLSCAERGGHCYIVELSDEEQALFQEWADRDGRSVEELILGALSEAVRET